MDTFLRIFILGPIVLILLAIIRAYKGPSALDRVVAMNVITANISVLILIFSYLGRAYFYIDVALVFVLASFIATICILKLLKDGKLI